jgi:hypothetical protein
LVACCLSNPVTAIVCTHRPLDKSGLISSGCPQKEVCSAARHTSHRTSCLAMYRAAVVHMATRTCSRQVHVYTSWSHLPPLWGPPSKPIHLWWPSTSLKPSVSTCWMAETFSHFTPFTSYTWPLSRDPFRGQLSLSIGLAPETGSPRQLTPVQDPELTASFRVTSPPMGLGSRGQSAMFRKVRTRN